MFLPCPYLTPCSPCLAAKPSTAPMSHISHTSLMPLPAFFDFLPIPSPTHSLSTGAQKLSSMPVAAGGRYDALLRRLWPAAAAWPAPCGVGVTINVDRLVNQVAPVLAVSGHHMGRMRTGCAGPWPFCIPSGARLQPECPCVVSEVTARTVPAKSCSPAEPRTSPPNPHLRPPKYILWGQPLRRSGAFECIMLYILPPHAGAPSASARSGRGRPGRSCSRSRRELAAVPGRPALTVPSRRASGQQGCKRAARAEVISGVRLLGSWTECRAHAPRCPQVRCLA